MRRTFIAVAAFATMTAVPATASTVAGSIPVATGYEQIRDGRLDVAERIVTAQMRAHPDAPELGLNLAAIYMRTGRVAQAAPLYERILAQPAIAMDMPSGSITSSHDVARRATALIASGPSAR